jgi:hypothetical protein
MSEAVELAIVKVLLVVRLPRRARQRLPEIGIHPIMLLDDGLEYSRSQEAHTPASP